MTESNERTAEHKDIGGQLLDLGHEIAVLISGAPVNEDIGLYSRKFDFQNGTTVTVAYNTHKSQTIKERTYDIGPEFILHRETRDPGDNTTRTNYRWAEHSPGETSHQHVVDTDPLRLGQPKKRTGFTQEDVDTINHIIQTAREIFPHA